MSACIHGCMAVGVLWSIEWSRVPNKLLIDQSINPSLIAGDDEASYVSAYEFEDDFTSPHTNYTYMSPAKAKVRTARTHARRYTHVIDVRMCTYRLTCTRQHTYMYTAQRGLGPLQRAVAVPLPQARPHEGGHAARRHGQPHSQR